LRAIIPSMLGLAQDQRRLGGGALRRIVLAGRKRQLVLDSDDGRLIAGFRGSEPAQRYRWTDSEAMLRPARAPARAAA
jgi:hypothetical protein